MFPAESIIESSETSEKEEVNGKLLISLRTSDDLSKVTLLELPSECSHKESTAEQEEESLDLAG